MNLVYRHPNGACIWQGDAPAARRVPVLDSLGIKAIVLAAREHQPKLPARFDVIRARLKDDLSLRGEMLRRTIKCADEVSDLLVGYMLRGESVLSTCWAGLNRSGLCTALTIMKLSGMPPAKVVRMVRNARGPFALSNPVFTQIIHSAAAPAARRAAATERVLSVLPATFPT
jgi:hypothetical protein